MTSRQGPPTRENQNNLASREENESETARRAGFQSNEEKSNATFLAARGIFVQQALSHPLFYGRSLIQMGFEPISQIPGKTIFGKSAWFYPNMFQYLKYIKNVDGFIGLYRGFGCALTTKFVTLCAENQVEKISESPEDKTSKTLSLNNTIKKTLQEIRLKSYGILISQPFFVMTVRCMAQFVGKETKYSSFNIFQNIRELYQENGIGGFFIGLIPRWIVEIGGVVLINFIIHLLRSQFSGQGDLSLLFDFVASTCATTLTYPFTVVSTVMAVNQSGLSAGKLPIVESYDSWNQAYKSLGKQEQLKRGSSIFNRLAPPLRRFT